MTSVSVVSDHYSIAKRPLPPGQDHMQVRPAFRSHCVEHRVRVREHTGADENKGKGLFAAREFCTGETLFVERPIAAQQTLTNRFEVLSCGNSSCLAPLPSIPRTQLQLLSREISRAALHPAYIGALLGEMTESERQAVSLLVGNHEK